MILCEGKANGKGIGRNFRFQQRTKQISFSFEFFLTNEPSLRKKE